jgi:serpin B
VLTTLGMGIAFGRGGLADFTGMSPRGHDLVISDVLQKTFVDVNEEGTEAAAVTKVAVAVTSAPATFTVDRPFVFAIRERLSGTILFMGKMERP